MDQQNSQKRQPSHVSRSGKRKSQTSKKESIQDLLEVHNAENAELYNYKNMESLEVQHKFTIQDKSFMEEFPVKNWDTAYIDGKYYLSDPTALARLRALDAQIQAEKEKLAYIDQTDNFNKSFLSHQHQQEEENATNQVDCLTQINESRLYARKKQAEEDLINEEQKYRAKLQGMKRKRSIMKKEIGCGTEDNQKFIQADEKKIASQTKQKQHREKDESVKKSDISKSNRVAQQAEIMNQENKPLASEKKSQQFHNGNIANKGPSERKSNSKRPSLKGSAKSIEKQRSEVQNKSQSRSFVKSSVKSVSKQKNPSEKEGSDSKVQKTPQASRVKQYEEQLLSKQVNNQETQQKQGSGKAQHHQRKESSRKSSVKNSFKESIKNSGEAIAAKSQASPSKRSSKIEEQINQLKEPVEVQKSVKASEKIISKQQESKVEKVGQKSINDQQSLSRKGSSQNKDQRYQKPLRSHRSRSKKSQLLQHIEKSKKSEPYAQQTDKLNSNSERPQLQANDKASSKSKASGNNVDQAKSAKKQHLKVPEIQIYSNSFRKTDKSVQWEEESEQKQQSKQSEKAKSISKASNASKAASKVSYGQQYEPTYFQQQDSQTENNKTEQIDQSSVNNKYETEFQESNAQQSVSEAASRVSQSIQDSRLNSKSSRISSMRNQNQQAGIPSQSQQIQRNFEKKSFQSNQSNSEFVIEKKQQRSAINASESQLASDKKQRSFIIHSKQHSARSKKSNSRHSRNPSHQKSNRESFNSSRVSKEKDQGEIIMLQKQIEQLQEKLKVVEEKQNKMIKYEEKQTKQLQQSQYQNQASSPLGKFMTSRLQLQRRLSLQGSTVQFNILEQKKKLTSQQNEKLEKLKLQEEIGRLKKIIRDMQLEKIMSIEHEPETIGSRIQVKKEKEQFQSRFQSRSRLGDKLKQSLNTDMLETKRGAWQTETVNKQEPGRIVKNSPMKSLNQTPRVFNRVNAEKIKQFSEMGREDGDFEHEPLPLRRKMESTPPQNQKKDLTKSQLLEKCDRNQREFHKFLQSSRLMQEPQSMMEQNNLSMPEAFAQHNETQNYFHHQKIEKIPEPKKEEVSSLRRNFSQIAAKLKNENPEQKQIFCKPITINNIDFPELPQNPNLTMSQDDLLEIARKTFSIFGIDIDKDQNQLSMKKYKNCVVFSLNGNPDSILWHYSGKFYLGGWKNSEPGEGQKTGQGLECFPGKHVYRGQFLNGKKNGNGILKLQNGNIYEGQWVEGVKSGRGVYFQASTGTYYSGEWKEGKRDGYGILKFSDLEFYQGTFVKSVKHGYGVQRFGNGDLYRGEYQRGKFHGKGRYVWANGSSYEGDFIEGCRHGQGNWKSSRNGGDIYIGAYQSDKKCGYGRYIWANGCTYEGQFRGDLKNGKGRLIYQDGKEVKGLWEDGNLISNDNERKIPEHQESPLKRSVRASSLRGSSNPNPFYSHGY